MLRDSADEKVSGAQVEVKTDGEQIGLSQRQSQDSDTATWLESPPQAG